ncbi:MAG: biofilm regulation protein phosphatase SiaA [Halomonas sp.]|uniref:biofilm regulation protein phosphatase SiaA n=1 Tax=Halomonas sp. TaxID=1486246 RepID=UPI0028707839|nr:biofilm regulation protein phosphatase SiaA [Halomonas sp.]MDR9438683.1 biofilm regulation protein phosphatase SiaA [Halomonas sp.]
MAALLGLRGKSVGLLLLACLLALIPAGLIGWKAVDEVRRHFASAYAEQYTLLQMQRIMAPLTRELALSRRFANSIVTREWLRAPDDPERRERLFREAEGYRQQFTSGAFFIIEHASGDYYFNDGDRAEARQPAYRLSPQREEDAWYFATMDSSASYNINVNEDRTLERTMIWLNIKVMDDSEPLGLAGGSIDLSDFLDRFIRSAPAGITPMIIDSRGAFQAHADPSRITLSSVNASQTLDGDLGLHAMVGDAAEQEALRSSIQQATRRPGEIVTLTATLEDEPRLLTLGYIPELQWLMVTALDLSAYPLLDSRWFWPMVMALGLILAILMGAFAYATHRLILRPLHRLNFSAQAIASGDYSPRLPTGRNDEIGELSRSFSHMARRVEGYTRDLEGQVRQRTQALEEAHAQMVSAHRQLEASIQYASIIQQAILPDDALEQHLRHRYGVLWKPRDVVGGDFYVFRATDHGYLLGIVDCAGHGVPGALMTMLARAIIDHALTHEDADDPAAVLGEIDRQGRMLLPQDQLPASIATSMDIGLVWVDPVAGTLTYAGAKIDLHASDGEHLETLAGHRRALGHRRPARYENQQAPLRPGWTYTLCSDGFLDQAGGSDGFGFGNYRFRAMVLAQASRPLEEQMAAYEETLRAHQGDLPQRDDITLLAFRLEPPPYDAPSPQPSEKTGDTR